MHSAKPTRAASKAQHKAQKVHKQQKKVTKVQKRTVSTKKALFPKVATPSPKFNTIAPVQPSFKMQPVSAFRATKPVFDEAASAGKPMKDFFEISITSPNFSPYVKQKAYAVYVATTHGERGILHNAAPLIATLRPGVLQVFEEEKQTEPKKFFVPAGVVRIANDDKSLAVTCSEIIPVEELDGDAAKKVFETASAAANAATDGMVKAKHTIAMNVADAIVKAVEKYQV